MEFGNAPTWNRSFDSVEILVLESLAARALELRIVKESIYLKRPGVPECWKHP